MPFLDKTGLVQLKNIIITKINQSINAHNTSSSSHEDIRELLNTMTDDEFLVWLVEADIIEPTISPSGEIYTTNNNEIYIL